MQQEKLVEKTFGLVLLAEDRENGFFAVGTRFAVQIV